MAGVPHYYLHRPAHGRLCMYFVYFVFGFANDPLALGARSRCLCFERYIRLDISVIHVRNRAMSLRRLR